MYDIYIYLKVIKAKKTLIKPHGSPYYIMHDRKCSNWFDKQGMGYPTDISSDDLAW